MIKTTTWQPKRTTTTPPAPQPPWSKSCFIKVTSNSFQVVAKLRWVSQRKTTKNKYFVRVCETCFTAQESLLPWEVKSLRCTAGPGFWWSAAEFWGLWALWCRAQWNVSITGVLHWSHTALKLLKGRMNDTDHGFTTASHFKSLTSGIHCNFFLGRLCVLLGSACDVARRGTNATIPGLRKCTCYALTATNWHPFYCIDASFRMLQDVSQIHSSCQRF